MHYNPPNQICFQGKPKKKPTFSVFLPLSPKYIIVLDLPSLTLEKADIGDGEGIGERVSQRIQRSF